MWTKLWTTAGDNRARERAKLGVAGVRGRSPRVEEPVVEVHLNRREGCTVVGIVGELDLAGVPVVRPALLDALREDGGDVVIDLTGLDLIDSAGLGVVLGAVRRAREAGRPAKVVVRAPQVVRMFQVTGLDRVLDLRGDVEEAVGG